MAAWYENPRIFYDWGRYGEDLTADYAAEVVEKAVAIRADTLAFCTVLGGLALWDSQVTPRYDRLGGVDLIGQMSRLCRDRGLRFVPWWLATASGGTEWWLREHPEWQLTGPPQTDGTQVRQNYICYNTPYRDILYGEVREVVSQYEVDGIYFDQLPGSCYCDACQSSFREQFGQLMPVVADEFFVYNSPAGLPPMLRQFRDDCVRSFCAGIRSIISEVRPDTIYAQNWVRGVQAHLASEYADVLLPEFYQRQDLVPLGLRMRLTKAYFDDGPIWGNVRHSVRHDARHFPVGSTRMLLVDCLANRAAPLLLDLCAMDFDATGVDELATTFDHMEAMQQTLVEAEPVRYAALLHSRASHLTCADRFEEAFEGMYRLLFENHIPCELITEKAVAEGELEGYRVLVLGDAFALEDATVAAIGGAVDGGLGLVATHTSGFADADGNRRECPALSALCGVEIADLLTLEEIRGGTPDPLLQISGLDGPPFHYASAVAGHRLARGVGENSLFSFQGGYAACRPLPGSEVAAHIHRPDTERLGADSVNRRGLFPGPAGWPFLVVRESGRGRVAYFPAQLESERRRAHSPQIDSLLLNSLRWAGGPLPLETTDCPRSVEVRLFHDPQRHLFQVLLVNLTTNPLVGGSGGPAVVRYVTTVKDIQVQLPLPGPLVEVQSQIGSQVYAEMMGALLAIELPRLDLYDSLIIRYEDA
ncbi:alpha-amylase family protein [Candidatus Latescibacterota bacterium]